MADDLLPIERFEPPHTQAFLDELGQLRVAAWGQESGVSERIKTAGKWLDNKDEGAFHYVLKNVSTELVGAARVNIFKTKDKADYVSNFTFRRPVKGHVAVVSRLVLLREYHHRGLWRDFDSIRVSEIKAMDVDAILAICGSYRLEKLKSEGFEQAGEPFAERELPDHIAYPICHYLEK
jgi:predicted GNAT family N-acyltransferase